MIELFITALGSGFLLSTAAWLLSSDFLRTQGASNLTRTAFWSPGIFRDHGAYKLFHFFTFLLERPFQVAFHVRPSLISHSFSCRQLTALSSKAKFFTQKTCKGNIDAVCICGLVLMRILTFLLQRQP